MTTPEIMIQARNINKTYQLPSRTIVALDDINLDIYKGEIFGIIGYSGAGKSTLIRCFNMLETPTSGSIIIDGQDVTTLSDGDLRKKRREIGMIFQHFNLLSSRTVRANIAYPLEISGMKKAAIDERVNELLDLVGLANHADSYPAQLSGGQKQRVGIARAIANNPKVLLCDEATSALDPKTTLSILDLLRDINRRLNLTMVLITHEMEVIKNICDRVAVIDEGNIVELGSVIQVFSRPQTRIAHEFVKQVTNFEVPESLLTHFTSKVSETFQLLQLSFLGESTEHPVISDMIKQFDVQVSILHGQIDRIQSTPYGTLVITLDGPADAIAKARQFLIDNDVRIEVLTNGA